VLSRAIGVSSQPAAGRRLGLGVPCHFVDSHTIESPSNPFKQEPIMSKSFFQRGVSFSLAAIVTTLMLSSVNFLAQSDAHVPQQWALASAARA
jgi:hypothetical protein